MLVIWKKKSKEEKRKYRIAEMVASATTKCIDYY
jgi:ribosomal protein L35